MKLENGMHIYYQDYFGFKHDGEILWIREDGNFVVSNNPNTRIPQMDDSRRTLNLSDEGKLFWRYPLEEN